MAEIAVPLVVACLQPLYKLACDQGAEQLTPLCLLSGEVRKLADMLGGIAEAHAAAEDAHLMAAVEAVAERRNEDVEDRRRMDLRRVSVLYYDALDAVDTWNAALRSSTGCLRRGDIRRRIIASGVTALVQKVRSELAKPRGGELAGAGSVVGFAESSKLKPETTSLVHGESLHGRGKEARTLIGGLTRHSGSCDAVAVVGMGGIGKTALARLAFNSAEVRSCFDLRIWVSVPFSSFDLHKIGTGIVEAVNRKRPPIVRNELDALLRLVEEKIRGRRFLLVLDSVWRVEPAEWNQLRQALEQGGRGSKILVTTQKYDVVRVIEARDGDVVRLDLLPEDECRSMFAAVARKVEAAEKMDRGSLDDICEKFVSKCGGLPLLASDLQYRMRCDVRIREWEKVLQRGSNIAQDNVFASFLLSYCEMSILQRRCFSLCSVFPRNHAIEVDDLVTMWISFIPSVEREENLEEKGSICFEALRDRNLFRDFSKDYEGNVVKCKMHNAVREFAHFFTKHDAGEPNRSQASGEARHFTLLLEASEARIPIENGKKLRTLFVHRSEAQTPTVPLSCDALVKLMCLRTLHMCRCNIEQLPNALDKLLHLRYLNLSGNPLRELPKSLCKLWNLLTLRMKDCTQLQSLPEEIGRLENLRHLYIEGCNNLTALPKGIQRCTHLRVLDTFVVADDQMSKSLKLGDLEVFQHLLQKIICIYRCGNLKAVDLRSGAVIHRYVDLKLELNFEGSGNNDEQEAIVRELQPSSELMSLEIRGFNGTILHPTLMDSLNYLRRVVLGGCQNLNSLPPLGKMLQLESLRIDNMANVQNVGLEFLGITSDDDNAISFTKLKELCFDELPSWTEWTEVKRSSVMPCLISLKISGCNGLKALPGFLWTITVLQDLEINRCHESLKESCRALGTSGLCKISRANGFRIPNIEIDGEMIRSLQTVASSSNSISPGSSSSHANTQGLASK